MRGTVAIIPVKSEKSSEMGLFQNCRWDQGFSKKRASPRTLI